jgi:predicted Rossmann fold nucleotide-binding protein DprA/Smf involved in DNA uptake
MRRVAVVGSRSWTDTTAVIELVHRLANEGAKVVSGGAKGVDSLAEREARWCGNFWGAIKPQPTAAHKGAFREAAFERNREIVQVADEVVAFWDGQSNGTANTIAWAVALGRPVTVHTPERVKAWP